MGERVKKNSMARDVWWRLKRNKLAMVSLGLILLMVLLALFGSWIAPYSFSEQNYDAVLEAPSGEHLFGTDNFGRDVFSRIIIGTSYTVAIGFGCMTAATVIGIFFGIIAAYYPRFDNLIMRVMDLMIGIPGMALLMCLISVMGISIRNMVLALIIFKIPTMSRVVRAQAPTVKQQEFIEAEAAIGAGPLRIIMRHILPNSIAPILVQYTLGVGNVVLWSASLSFIGMGVQVPNPEWGLMISAGRAYLRDSPHLGIIPGVAIIVLTFALNLLGDGLRDALDPRLNK